MALSANTVSPRLLVPRAEHKDRIGVVGRSVLSFHSSRTVSAFV